jgi:ABC-type transport system involved in multi-copper enzyme maturation permease subunit
MKNKVRRTVLMLLLAVILFSASTAIPALFRSGWKNLVQGAALGLTIAGIISMVTLVIDYLRETKKGA